MRLLAVLGLCALLNGCAVVTGQPAEIDCTGKVALMAGPYTFMGDCGEGFHYRAAPPTEKKEDSR